MDAHGEERNEQAPTGPVAWWRRPAVLGVLGLGLMIAGWKVTTYEPARRPASAEARRLDEEVRRLAEQDRALARKLKEYPRPAAPPPYRLLGRVVFLVGLGLFVAAGVLMYRQPGEEPAGEGPPETP